MRKFFKCMFSIALAASLAAVLSSAAVTAHAEGGCEECEKAGLTFKALYATTEYKLIDENVHAQYYKCNNGHKQLRYNADGTLKDAVLHTYDAGKVTDATCAHEGYTTYTCTACGNKLITDKVPQLSHWYAEWTPAGSGMNSAPCKRNGCNYVKTTDCVDWDFLLTPAGAEKAEGYSVCPVCGETSDGTRLTMVNNVTTKPITGWTPEGDLLFREGYLENGEKIICVSFEFDARLAQDTGKTDFIVPAEVLDGYKVMLLDAEGNETELEVRTTGTKSTITLDFGTIVDGHRIPVRMLHLVPVAE